MKAPNMSCHKSVKLQWELPKSLFNICIHSDTKHFYKWMSVGTGCPGGWSPLYSWRCWTFPDYGPQQPQQIGSCFKQEFGLSSFPFTGFFHQLCSQKLKRDKTNQPPKTKHIFRERYSSTPGPQLFPTSTINFGTSPRGTFQAAPSKPDLVEVVNQSS